MRLENILGIVILLISPFGEFNVDFAMMMHGVSMIIGKEPNHQVFVQLLRICFKFEDIFSVSQAFHEPRFSTIPAAIVMGHADVHPSFFIHPDIFTSSCKKISSGTGMP